jgi:hypothetical protein
MLFAAPEDLHLRGRCSLGAKLLDLGCRTLLVSMHASLQCGLEKNSYGGLVEVGEGVRRHGAVSLLLFVTTIVVTEKN